MSGLCGLFLYFTPRINNPPRLHMEHSANKQSTLLHLITEYEAMSQKGDIAVFEEKTFFTLIQFYESEFSAERALEVIDHALEIYTYSVDFYLRKAELLFNVKQYSLADAVITQAETLAPNDILVALMRARYKVLTKQYHEALAIIDQVKSQDESHLLTEILLTEAFIYDQSREYDKQFDVLSQLLQRDHSNLAALEKISSAVENTKKYNESIQLHQQIIDKDPYSYQAWYNLAHAYSCTHEYERAIDAYEYVYIINKDFEAAYRDRGDLCLELCNFKEALKSFKEANDVFGADPDTLTNIGQCLIHLDQSKHARKYLTKALKIDPYNEELHYYIGLSFAKERSWVNAINAFKRALEMDDTREEYLASLGDAYFHLNEFSKAIYYFKKAVKDGPEQSFIWMSYANFLLATNRIKESLLVLEKGEYFANCVELTYVKSAAYFLLEDSINGMKVLEEALQTDPEMHSILFSYAPHLMVNHDIQSMINYYSAQ